MRSEQLFCVLLKLRAPCMYIVYVPSFDRCFKYTHHLRNSLNLYIETTHPEPRDGERGRGDKIRVVPQGRAKRPSLRAACVWFYTRSAPSVRPTVVRFF